MCVQTCSETSPSPQRRHATAQTSPNDLVLRSAGVQTEHASSSSALQNSALRTVRITRMQRLSSQSQPALQCHSCPQKNDNDSYDSVETSQSVAHRPPEVYVGASRKHPPEARKTRSCSETRRLGRSASSSQALALTRIEQEKALASLLRCPDGHGLQLIRSCSQSKEALHCNSCAAVISNGETFHGCAVCYQDSGERRAICGTCSRRRFPHLSDKALFFNRISRTHASDWSAVSSMLPSCVPEHSKSALTNSALNEALARLEERSFTPIA